MVTFDVSEDVVLLSQNGLRGSIASVISESRGELGPVFDYVDEQGTLDEEVAGVDVLQVDLAVMDGSTRG